MSGSTTTVSLNKIVFYNIQMKAATKGLMICLKSENIEDIFGDNYKLQYNFF